MVSNSNLQFSLNIFRWIRLVKNAKSSQLTLYFTGPPGPTPGQRPGKPYITRRSEISENSAVVVHSCFATERNVKNKELR